MNFSLLYVRGETLWWDIDKCVKETVTKRIPTETNGISFTYESGFLFITLPSYRRLAYVKPRIGINKYGSEAVTYEGSAVQKSGNGLKATVLSSVKISFKPSQGIFCSMQCRH